MIGRMWLLVGCVVGLAVVWSGCGGSSDAALTKQEFIEQADAICAKADKEQTSALELLGKSLTGNPSSAKNQERIVKGGLVPVQQEAEEIAELSPPKGDEAEVAAIVEGIEEAVKKTEADPSHANEATFAPVGKLAAKYGFKACSEPL